jgi:hypothetical protein
MRLMFLLSLMFFVSVANVQGHEQVVTKEEKIVEALLKMHKQAIAYQTLSEWRQEIVDRESYTTPEEAKRDAETMNSIYEALGKTFDSLNAASLDYTRAIYPDHKGRWLSGDAEITVKAYLRSKSLPAL